MLPSRPVKLLSEEGPAELRTQLDYHLFMEGYADADSAGQPDGAVCVVTGGAGEF